MGPEVFNTGTQVAGGMALLAEMCHSSGPPLESVSHPQGTPNIRLHLSVRMQCVLGRTARRRDTG